ncbi:hypothetical protein, partial [Variovorax paradoxus]|uniref:hypothetical protein n=1 Tax=Variovorax paradoxus TaxID=34073 RepID=UPI0030CEF2F8
MMRMLFMRDGGRRADYAGASRGSRYVTQRGNPLKGTGRHELWCLRRAARRLSNPQRAIAARAGDRRSWQAQAFEEGLRRFV